MTRRRGAAIAISLLMALAWSIGAVAAAPSPGLEDEFVAHIARERASAGVPRYALAADLVDVARNHAEKMAREQRLHHNDQLGNQVQNWEAVGENVGKGGTVDDIHRAFMESSSHRSEILSTRFTQVGVGVVERDGVMWVVEVFRLPSEPERQASSEPSSSPPPSGDGSSGGDTSAPPSSAPSSTSTPPTTRRPPPPVTTTAATPAPVSPPAPPAPEAADPEALESAAAVEEAPSEGFSPAETPLGSSEPLLVAAARPVAQDLQIPQPLREVSAPIGIASALLVLVVAALAGRVVTDERMRVAMVGAGA